MNRFVVRLHNAGLPSLALVWNVLLLGAIGSTAWAQGDDPLGIDPTSKSDARAVVADSNSPTVGAKLWTRYTATVHSADDPTAQGEAKVREQLSRPTSMEFIDTPLQDVIDYLKDHHNIEIQLEKTALDEAGVGSDTPVTRTLKGQSLRSALRLMLNDLPTPLTYVVRDGMLLITTHDRASLTMELRVYNVGKLARDEDERDDLVDLLQSLFAPMVTVKEVAKDAPIVKTVSIRAFHDLLFVRASFDDQEGLNRVLIEMSEKLAPRD